MKFFYAILLIISFRGNAQVYKSPPCKERIQYDCFINKAKNASILGVVFSTTAPFCILSQRNNDTPGTYAYGMVSAFGAISLGYAATQLIQAIRLKKTFITTKPKIFYDE